MSVRRYAYAAVNYIICMYILELYRAGVCSTEHHPELLIPEEWMLEIPYKVKEEVFLSDLYGLMQGQSSDRSLRASSAPTHKNFSLGLQAFL